MKIVEYSHAQSIQFEGEFEGQQPQVRMAWIALICVVVPAAIVGTWKPVHPSFFAVWFVVGALIAQLIWAFGGDRRCSRLKIHRDAVEWSEYSAPNRVSQTTIVSLEIDVDDGGSARHRSKLQFSFGLDWAPPTRERRHPWILDIVLVIVRTIGLFKRPAEHEPAVGPNEDRDPREGSLDLSVEVDWIRREQWLDLCRRCALVLGMTHESVKEKDRELECRFHRGSGEQQIPVVDANLPRYMDNLEALESTKSPSHPKLRFRESIGALQTLVGCSVLAVPGSWLLAAVPRWDDWPLALLTLGADVVLGVLLSLVVGVVAATLIRDRLRGVRLDPSSEVVYLRGLPGRSKIPFSDVERVVLVKDEVVLDTAEGSILVPGDFEDDSPEQRQACVLGLCNELRCEASAFVDAAEAS